MSADRLTYPGLAVAPALNAEKIMVLAGSTAAYTTQQRYPKEGNFRSDVMFENSFGLNSFTHTVVTWRDNLGRTLLGFDPSGLIQVHWRERTDEPPTEAQVYQSLHRVREYVTLVMDEHFGEVVKIDILDLSKC